MINLAYRENYRRGGYDSSPSLDLSFLEKGFFQDAEKTIIREELLDAKALFLGKGFAKGGTTDQGNFGKKVSSSQLRNFFNDVRSLEAKITPENFEIYRPQIKMLKAKVSYARGRDKVSEAFENLISKCVDLIKDEKDFRAFILFFEAIVGFFYGEGGGKNQ